MDHAVERVWYQQSASRITIAAHLLGITAVVLMLVWLVHYRGGLQYDSQDPNLVFNCHSFFMFVGFIFVSGEAMMAYKTVMAAKKVQKIVHMMLNLVAMCFGIAGICAVFKYHDMLNLEDLYSLHSWIGLITICLFGLQWVFGFCVFMLPRASMRTRTRLMPWHVCGGRALLFMAICSGLTGLQEKASFLKLTAHNESRLISFTALAILLFGLSVDLSITLARYA